MTFEQRLQITSAKKQPYRIAYDEVEAWVMEFDEKARLCRSPEGVGIIFSKPVDATRFALSGPDGYRAGLWPSKSKFRKV